MAKDDRFVKLDEQGGFISNQIEIWVDRQTGVNYLFMQNGNAGGLTPLLDREGKPVVTPIPMEE